MWGHTGQNLLRAGVLSHRLGTLRDCMLGQLARQQKPYSSLYLPRSDGRPRSTRGHYNLTAVFLPLVVVSELACLSSNTLEQVVDERVHDAHGLGGDTGVRVHLLENLVDVDGVGLLPLSLLLLLVSLGDGLSLARLGSSLSGGLGWHDVGWGVQ